MSGTELKIAIVESILTKISFREWSIEGHSHLWEKSIYLKQKRKTFKTRESQHSSCWNKKNRKRKNTLKSRVSEFWLLRPFPAHICPWFLMSEMLALTPFDFLASSKFLSLFNSTPAEAERQPPFFFFSIIFNTDDVRSGRIKRGDRSATHRNIVRLWADSVEQMSFLFCCCCCLSVFRPRPPACLTPCFLFFGEGSTKIWKDVRNHRRRIAINLSSRPQLL